MDEMTLEVGFETVFLFWVNVNGFSDCGMSLPFPPLTRKDALPALTGNGSRHVVLHRHEKLTNTCWHYFNLL